MPDADGDGMNNWQKYVAGVDPTDPTSIFSAGFDQPMAQSQQDCRHTLAERQRQAICHSTLIEPFPRRIGSAIATNSGTGQHGIS